MRKRRAMRRVLPAVLATVLALSVTPPAAAAAYSVTVGGKAYTVEGPKPVSTEGMTGRGRDAVAVAKSQDGYAGRILKVKVNGAKKRLSYFGDIWPGDINRDNTGNWCSEFASWCVALSGVKGAKCMSGVKEYAREYSAKKRLFRFAPSAAAGSRSKTGSDKWFAAYRAYGTLDIEDLRPGDILQLNGGSGVPNHTAVFVKAGADTVTVHEGNTDPSPDASYVRTNSVYDAERVVAVIRPEYADNLGVTVRRPRAAGGDVEIFCEGLEHMDDMRYCLTVEERSSAGRRLFSARLASDSVRLDADRFRSGKAYTVKLQAVDKADGSRKDTGFAAVRREFVY